MLSRPETLRRIRRWAGSRPRFSLAAGYPIGGHSRPLGRLAYVGWAGHGNMGDEAVLAAYRAVFPSNRLVQVSQSAPLPMLTRRAPWRPLEGVALGGGTLIGWPGYRRTLESLLASDEELPAVMLGTGVEDSSFFGRNPLLLEGLRDADESTATGEELFWRELGRWSGLLQRFEGVAVRGPRSRATLGRIGIEAEVVGDPALLLADDAPADPFSERLLGINVGIARGMWGGDPAAFLDTVVDFARIMQSRGWRIRFVPVWPADVSYIEEAARRIGRGVEVFRDFLELERLFAAIRECHVFVGQKLHSVVFSSAVYVPSVMLEYHPKCADFHDSLGRSRYTMRTDRVSADALVTVVDELACARDAHREVLVAEVGMLRARLLAAAERARLLIGTDVQGRSLRLRR
jgi:hypothetical protein